ncbi:MAG: TIGR02221 family CRISPR-associated protein [Bacteroidales bacterium]|nr:TIGR02221 family CRISPR-associated protein [Bacteroidales bacterium]
MSRNVFLSILGASPYKLTKYYFNNNQEEYFETYFIQEATIRFFCKEWTANDKICILVTSKSKENNWNDPCGNGYKGLSKILSELHLNPTIEVIDIPDGYNEKEIWEIFDKIYNAIQEEDKLYIDITHAFRSLPMLLTVLLNYAKVLKKVSVHSLTYGNYEARKDDFSPVIDLTALSELQDWTIAANNFVAFGVANMLSELTKKEINPILKDTKGKDIAASQLRTLSDNLSQFTLNLSTLRGQKILKGENVKKIISTINESVNQNTLIPQLVPLLTIIKEKTSSFSEEDPTLNFLAATNWYIQHQQYQQAYSILLEGLITYICKQNNIEETNVKKRDLVTSACYILENNLEEDNWSQNCKDNYELTKKLIDYMSKNRNLLEEIRILSMLRNDFMHAGFREHPVESKKIIEKIKESYNNIKKIIE